MYAFDLSCPHQNTALKWDDRDHAFHYPNVTLSSGPLASTSPIAAGRLANMDRFAIAKEGSRFA